MKLLLDQNQPIYLQIIDEIKRSLARGDLKPGDRIPSQRELAEMAHVNPNTVQRAYREMEQADLVETLRGQGTFVKKDENLVESIRREMADQSLSSFVKEMQGLGYTLNEIVHLVTQVCETETRGDEANGDG